MRYRRGSDDWSGINSRRNKNIKITGPYDEYNEEILGEELVLIFHGRLSDLERYGRIKNQVDIYKIFNGLLSVHIVGCDVHHTGIKALVENNKGKFIKSEKSVLIRNS